VGVKSGMAIAVVLLISGCGDGDGGGRQRETEVSGVFQGGNVIGLHYRTPTREGVTDANGSFRYLAGEPVTFSIGSIVLGSASGAATISPFTLAGMAPPTTELDLRRELRATRTTTPFVRAINMARLLLVLDADHDAANGIDLRGRESALAGASINFGTGVPGFAVDLETLAPDLPQDIPLWAPVVHLYRSLNIVVPAHATTRTEWTGGSLAPGVTRVSTTTYASNGLLEAASDDTDGDGVVEREMRRSYDSVGRELSTVDLRRDFPLLAYRVSSTRTFDALGNAVGQNYEIDYGVDGSIDSRSVLVSSFDSFGRLLTAAQTSDNGMNAVRYRSTQSFTYDARGNPASHLQLIDNDGDGDVDERVHETFSHDTEGRVLSRTYEEDFNADGVVDSRQSTVVTWAADGTQVTQDNVTDQDADGTPDYSSTTTWSYDSPPRLASVVQERDEDADGTIDYGESATLSYDGAGREILNVQTHDFDGDGTADESIVVSREYDANGNQTSSIQETDLDADGTPDWRRVEVSTFGNSGEPLEVRTEIDSGADGTVESTARSTDTHLLIDAGVAMLTQKHFEGGGYVSAFF
jgi:hypothetical protein